MNLSKIQEIINAPIPEEIKEKLILQVIAADREAISYVLTMLHEERSEKKELIMNMNLELSRAHTLIRNKNVYDELKDFVDGEICTFYETNKNQVRHCFNNMDRPKPDTK